MLQVYATVMFPEKENALELAQHKNIEIVKLDVTKQDNIDELVRFISEDLKKNGRQFWCLVNNAGVALYSDLEVASMDHFTSTLDVNTVGPLRMCKSFLPLLRAGGQGRIVNIASQAVPFTTAYSMSKAALIAFSDGLRRELTPWNISVITIEPYFYQAAISLQYTINLIVGNYLRMWDSAPEEVKEALGERFRDARIQGLMEFCVKNQRTEDKLYEVIDDLEHAVASVRPQISYNPSTHAKLVTMLLNCLPLEVQDFLLTPVIEEKPRNIIISKMESRQRS
ncbi:hypothetical protein HAZT_HAZT001695 [Hyalella azteca]|uniref:Uncharacterized protein n=1 Tax=Hyalella azteca TaxID=294128 RepID=A0A6A0H3V1_HYAAZ|nr:hypothetical protein HAZT_HAZT001695 [Hyalella azteca]